MRFSPQRRAFFRHQNFRKCSEPGVFCTFSLQNAFFATAAYNFETSELPNVLRTWRVLYIFPSNCAFRHSRVQFLIFSLPHDSAPAALTSLLLDWPDTGIIEKTQHFATSLTFGADESSFFWLSRYCVFFLLTLLHLICFSSAFQLSILSEVYYLNFFRSVSRSIQIMCYTCSIKKYIKKHIILLSQTQDAVVCTPPLQNLCRIQARWAFCGFSFRDQRLFHVSLAALDLAGYS